MLNSLADGLFFSILSVGGGGGGAGGGLSKEDMVSEVQVHILEKLREDFVMLEIRMRIKEKGSPFVVFVLQELERMNKILSAMRTQLNELALGLSGALNISDSMDALINSIFMNQVYAALRAQLVTDPPDICWHPSSAGSSELAQSVWPNRTDWNLQSKESQRMVC